MNTNKIYGTLVHNEKRVFSTQAYRYYNIIMEWEKIVPQDKHKFIEYIRQEKFVLAEKTNDSKEKVISNWQALY